MAAGQLDEQRIDRADLHAAAPACVADLRSLDVIVEIRVDEVERRQAFDEAVPIPGAREPLQEFLDDDAGRHHRMGAQQRLPQCFDLRHRHGAVAP